MIADVKQRKEEKEGETGVGTICSPEALIVRNDLCILYEICEVCLHGGFIYCKQISRCVIIGIY